MPAPPSAPPSLRGPFRKGETERAILAGAALDLRRGTSGAELFALQARWGRVLASPRTSGLWRGTVEYLAEFAPAILVRSSRPLFGASLTPLLLQYNFTGHARIVPFVQLGAGMLFTTRRFPAGGSAFNFTPQAAWGLYWLHPRGSAVLFGLRYQHISNLGITRPNPGHEALFFYSGISWWH